MKRRAAPLVFFTLICVTCDGVDNVNVSAEGQTTVPAATPVEQLLGSVTFLGDFSSFDITQTEEFQNQGYTRDQIDSVIVTRFTLSVSDPPGGTFDFLDGIAFFAESEGLPRVKIAELDPVPEGASEIELELFDAELVDYATAESMSITTEANGSRPAEETTVDAAVVLNVDVSVSGAACSVR